MARLVWTQKQDIGPSAKQATPWPSTAREAESCSLAATPRDRLCSTTRGSGMARTGRRPRTLVQAPARNMPWHTTMCGRPSCCLVDLLSRRPRRTLGNGTAPIGRKSLTPARRPAAITQWRSTVDEGGSSSSVADSLVVALEAVGDTWEWDGEEWAQQEDVGPPARVFHAMAYDAVRDRVVLFGGVNRPDGARRHVGMGRFRVETGGGFRRQSVSRRQHGIQERPGGAVWRHLLAGWGPDHYHFRGYLGVGRQALDTS